MFLKSFRNYFINLRSEKSVSNKIIYFKLKNFQNFDFIMQKSVNNNKKRMNISYSKEKTTKKTKKETKQKTLLNFNFSEKKSETFEFGDGKINKDKIDISSWNINGIRAVEKNKNLSKYIENYNPDILCLSELKIDKEAFQKENIKNTLPLDKYQCFFNFCKPPIKGYSGVAIFSKFKVFKIQQYILILIFVKNFMKV